MKLILELLEDDMYKIVLSGGMAPQNQLPDVRFDRNENNEVFRLTFIHDDGREEHSMKD